MLDIESPSSRERVAAALRADAITRLLRVWCAREVSTSTTLVRMRSRYWGTT
jgi:hypothetical protein